MRIARWHAWEPLAARLPDGHVLSVELLRSRPDQAFAVFTVVRGHVPVQHVVGTALDVTGDAAASPNVIALGQPPEKEPPPPGITAQGSSLLSIAF